MKSNNVAEVYAMSLKCVQKQAWRQKKIVRYVMVAVLAPSSAPVVDILKISECVCVGGCFIFWTFTKYELATSNYITLKKKKGISSLIHFVE